MEDKRFKKQMNKVGGFKEITIGVILVAVFALAMFNFAALTAINNGATNSILDDPTLGDINQTLENELDDIRSSAQGQRESFEQQEAQGNTADEGFSLTSIVGIVKTFFSTALSAFNIIFLLLAEILGIPAIVLNVIIGGIIMVVLILVWRVIKIGGT